MDLGTLFEFTVKRFPDKIAITQDNIRLSYKEMNKQINRLAYSLQKKGIEKGDRVVIILKNRLEMVTFYWAIQKIGAIFTPINFRLSTEEVAYCVNNADAKAIIYEPSSQDAALDGEYTNKPLLIGVLGATGSDVTYEELLDHEQENFHRPTIQFDDTCLMLYTSGTTGKPKGVPRSHKNEYGAAIAHIIQNQYVLHESTLGVMPLYHTMGMRSLLSMAFLNGKLVMIPDNETIKMLTTMEEEAISCVYLVPTIIHDLLNHKDFSKFNLQKLRKIGYAGASMTTELTKACYQKLKPDVFVNHYGSTEVYTFSICDYLDKKPGCAGKPGLHQELRVVTPDPEGYSTPDDLVPQGTPGEIIVNIDSIEAFKGYWKRPDANKKAIRNGWYFTGDMGVLDEDGDLYVVGRVDDMIISGGENIHPLEVEDVLASHPEVLEVAVVGVPDDRYGEKVVAFVVDRNGKLSVEELDQYCKVSESLANFKRPREYYFVPEIPKSPVGKILRRKLKENYKTYSIKEESVS
ncbi:AMP-binding protein [Bacillus sp. DTU_2020_1000418_1_SI_GHA_SEK_038]|uniref:class I adenylate-forming enzyme family protein n=1 Tax=Bacillus sp. DTU_2020_1000418_1_SI_GHA_SEK_038 TaxID=3077585 RepID=UPI0028ED730A|nr:AMP-binding protein [Bacillus sp. DTU_2020_1000418_1_SI_GHA_SEK_038]WNS73645.1 AMP-binding protein [Bacillus sp. DTU_2020_1000418_1_SI_GHA_SEK_038]